MIQLPKIDLSKIEKKYFFIVPVILIIFILMMVMNRQAKPQGKNTNQNAVNVINQRLGSGENVLVVDREVQKSSENDNTQKLVVVLWVEEENLIYEATQYFMTRNPGVFVEFKVISFTDYLDNIGELLRNQQQLDVFLVRNVSQYAEAVSRGFAFDTDQMIRGAALDTSKYGTAYQGLRIGGKTYGLPYKRNIYVLFYNRDVFSRLNFSIPEEGITWDIYRALAGNISRNTGHRTFGAFVDTSAQNWYIQAIQRGGSLEDDDLIRFEEAIRYRLQLELEGGVVRYGLQEHVNMHFNPEFQKGTIGMHVSGDWHLKQLLEANVGFQWGIAKAPYPQNGNPNLTIGNYSLAMVNANTRNLEGAFSYVSFLGGNDGAPFIAQKNVLPGYIDSRVARRFEDSVPSGIKGAEHLWQQDFILEYPATPSGKKLATEIFYEEGRKVFLGTSTLNDFTEQVRGRRNTLYP
jgi:multiple sugar transport system substrate-binding protein